MIIEALALFFLIFTSLFGIISLIRILASRIFERNIPEKTVSVLPVEGHEDRIEWILRGLLSEKGKRVAVLDLGMDRETREIAGRIAESNPTLAIVELDGVSDFFRREMEKNGEDRTDG